MCVNPNQLQDGTPVACRKCWQCKRQIINDWAGRIIAESKTDRFTYYVTLTYGRDEYGDADHINAAVLTYSDAQKYFKRLRKTVGKFKYFVVGEYGEKKGRAHWHVILFTNKEIPDIKTGVNFMETHWDHGWTYIEKFHPQQAYYCCKYVFKDYKDDLKTALHNMSKKPPLGHEYFQQLAGRYVRDGLAPQDLSYSFPEQRDKKGKLIRYMMKHTTADNYCASYVDQWQAVHPQRHIPPSPVIDEYLDKITRELVEREDAERLEKEIREWLEYVNERKQEIETFFKIERPDPNTVYHIGTSQIKIPQRPQLSISQ